MPEEELSEIPSDVLKVSSKKTVPVNELGQGEARNDWNRHSNNGKFTVFRTHNKQFGVTKGIKKKELAPQVHTTGKSQTRKVALRILSRIDLYNIFELSKKNQIVNHSKIVHQTAFGIHVSTAYHEILSLYWIHLFFFLQLCTFVISNSIKNPKRLFIS